MARRLVRAVLAAALAAAVIASVLVAGIAAVGRDNGLESRPALPEGTGPGGSAAADGTGKIRVAFVLGSSGTEAADVLAPYEVFATSPRFTVTTVAGDRSPVQLAGAPALVPAVTFGDIDAGRAPAPDLLVVPAVVDPGGDGEAATRSWIARQSARGIRILGVCAGSMLLAEAGVLDGHRATSHWSRISSLRENRPAVHWVTGQRFVRDGRITTTAGVTSGIPGALQLVHDLAGESEAARVGAEIGYPGWSTARGTAIADQTFTTGDAPVVLNAVLPWFRPTVGIGLTDGIGELDAVAAFEVYTISGAARTLALAAAPTVRTKHGLVLLTTPLASQEPHLDRLILPGNAAHDSGLLSWARSRQLTSTALIQSPERAAFDVALEELAGHAGNATAIATAKFIDYPTGQLHLDANATDTRSIWLLFLTAVLAASAGALPSLVRRAPYFRGRKTRTPEPEHMARRDPS
ncbi:DJ-1/PfpI family protein [Arthrobacter sp. AFG20]|uniref:DJ-1/PfpI family protein n=1 Tax=Arthrobacter sp. AFG20 TaxID=1688671 RepID=UPI0015E09825|nr:DJ-1/PfpI family protein [Arthrobacter sp. AFG20]